MGTFVGILSTIQLTFQPSTKLADLKCGQNDFLSPNPSIQEHKLAPRTEPETRKGKGENEIISNSLNFWHFLASAQRICLLISPLFLFKAGQSFKHISCQFEQSGKKDKKRVNQLYCPVLILTTILLILFCLFFSSASSNGHNDFGRSAKITTLRSVPLTTCCPSVCLSICPIFVPCCFRIVSPTLQLCRRHLAIRLPDRCTYKHTVFLLFFLHILNIADVYSTHIFQADVENNFKSTQRFLVFISYTFLCFHFSQIFTVLAPSQAHPW